MQPSIPRAGEHALIVGQNGSGKTKMLAHLLRQVAVAPVFVLDTKIDDEFLSLVGRAETIEVHDEGIESFRKLLRGPARNIPDYVIIRPPADEIQLPMVLDEYIAEIHNRYKYQCVIAVDELYMVHNGGRCGPGLVAALTRGRSRGHSFIGASQRPAWLSRFCLSEAAHYYIFRLADINDRKKLTHIGYDPKTVVERYHYLQYNTITDQLSRHPPLQLDDDQKIDEKFTKRGWI